MEKRNTYLHYTEGPRRLNGYLEVSPGNLDLLPIRFQHAERLELNLQLEALIFKQHRRTLA
jgi:hypothetical protein